jgi:hypothetical protein
MGSTVVVVDEASHTATSTVTTISDVSVLPELSSVSVVAVTTTQEQSNVTVTHGYESTTLTTTERETTVVGVGIQGPAGPPGSDGSSTLIRYSTVPIGGSRAVILDDSGNVQYAECTTRSHALKLLGVTRGAASAGAPIEVIREGEVLDSSWSWTLNEPIYLTINGVLSQTLPGGSPEFYMIVGFPTSTTSIFVDLQPPILTH